jgi:hypothetical protein
MKLAAKIFGAAADAVTPPDWKSIRDTAMMLI